MPLTVVVVRCVSLAIHQRKLTQEPIMTGSFIDRFREPGSWVSVEDRSTLSRKYAKKRLVCR